MRNNSFLFIVLQEIKNRFYILLNFTLKNILPPIRVNSWGGIGSQLFALNLMFDLSIKYPMRKILFLQHNGGVTKRENEINFVKNTFYDTKFVKDYSIDSNFKKNKIEDNKRPDFKIKLKQKIFTILVKIGFMATCNTDAEFSKLKPWICDIRGHYLIRKVTSQFMALLNKELNLDNEISTGAIAIHYRLGDMVNLDKKFDSSSIRIINHVTEINNRFGAKKILLFSDSISLAYANLNNHEFLQKVLKIECYNLSTLESIKKCVLAEYFVGTESKVSLWIVNLRNFRNQQATTYFDYFSDLVYKPIL